MEDSLKYPISPLVKYHPYQKPKTRILTLIA